MKMIKKTRLLHMRFLRTALFSAALILVISPLYAAFTVSAITPSTINIIAGQTLSLNFTYASDTANRQIGYFVALSTQFALRVGNTAGQDIIVSDAGVNVLVPAGQVNGGRQVGCGTQCTANTSYQISGIEGGQLPITIPINYPTGTYYIIVAVADWNIYLNPSIGTNSNMYVAINVTAPTPTYTFTPTVTATGVQNVGLSDYGFTNHVAYIMYTGTPSPTVDPTFTRTPTPTFTVSSTSTRTATNTFTPTATPTSTYTITPSPTFTFTVTDTPTFTYTSTDTPTFTQTDTPTFTPTSTFTKTFTQTSTPTNTISSDTPTFTPSYTMTYTVTQSYTATQTYTSTFTDTYTMTATPTYTLTSTYTDTPSFTQTYTVTFTFTDTPVDSPTDTPTATPTFTASPTFTATQTNTPTYTQSNTPTATQTFTASPTESATRTNTPTYTQSNTQTSTPTYTDTTTATYTFTDTPTFTPTFTKTDTPTFTATFTATPTYTQTSTYTMTPTITPTPAPYPYLLEINAYNEAGEKVRTIGTSSVSGLLAAVTTLINGSPSSLFVPGPGSVITFDFDSMTSPSQPAAGQVIFSWDGESDSGQVVPPGVYYIKITDIDTYGHVNTKVLEIQVMTTQQATMISIYNSAGELVQRIQQEPIQTGSLKLSMKDIFSIGYPGDFIPINYGPGSIYNWDGKNAQGELVGSGVYEVQVQAFYLNSTSISVSKSINILNGGKNNLISGQKAYPNPYVLSSGTADVSIAWQAGATGLMDIKIYNAAGELVKAMSAALESGKANWDLSASRGGGVASGLYIILLEARSNGGITQVKRVKFAVIKEVRDDDVIN